MVEGGSEDPIVIQEEAEDEPLGPTGVINPKQVAHHQQLIKEALQDFQRRVKNGEIKDVLLQLIQEIMEILKRVYPPIAEANIMVIMHSIPDPTCLALRPMTMETEGML